MTTEKTIVSIKYHALASYHRAGMKRLARLRAGKKKKLLEKNLTALETEMQKLAEEYRAPESSAAAGGILPPPPPPPPPPPKEVWP